VVPYGGEAKYLSYNYPRIITVDIANLSVRLVQAAIFIFCKCIEKYAWLT